MQQDRFPVQIVDEFLVPLPQHLPIISEFERVAVNVVDASDEILQSVKVVVAAFLPQKLNGLKSIPEPPLHHQIGHIVGAFVQMLVLVGFSNLPELLVGLQVIIRVVLLDFLGHQLSEIGLFEIEFFERSEAMVSLSESQFVLFLLKK